MTTSASNPEDALDDPNGDNAEGDGDEDEDDWSDTSSMLHDLLQDEDDVKTQIPSDFSEEEAALLKRKLRQHGPNEFIKETITSGAYSAKSLLPLFGITPPEWFEGRDDDGYYRLLGMAIVRFLTLRQKLSEYNTIDDVVSLIRNSSKIMVITGAGISTSLGIPDFRSANTGFYAQMQAKGFESAEDIFDYHTFKLDPTVFYENSGQMLPEVGKSTPTHAFIKLLDDKDKLLTNYTQNIDDIEGNIGISRRKLIQCHGSWAFFTCLTCHINLPGKQFYDTVRQGRVVYCPNCHNPANPRKRKRSSGASSRSQSRRRWDENDDDDDDPRDQVLYGVMKPNITFFHEQLPDQFFDRFRDKDKHVVDLVIVIGTSLTVAPVSEIPLALDPSVPHVLISRDRLKHIEMDVTLLGDCDTIVEELCKRLRWDFRHHMLRHKSVDVTAVDEGKAIWRVDRRETNVERALNLPDPQTILQVDEKMASSERSSKLPGFGKKEDGFREKTKVRSEQKSGIIRTNGNFVDLTAEGSPEPEKW